MTMTREKAIQILSTRDAHGVLCGYTSGVTEALDMAIEALKDKPKGEWYIREYEYFTCDQCGEDVWSGAESTQEAKEMVRNGDTPNYCPNCGADMRGSTE